MTRSTGISTPPAPPMPMPRPRAWAAPPSRPSARWSRPTSAPTAAGTWSPTRAPSTPNMWSMPAASGRARSGPWPGVYFPLHPMEHQYLVTDDVPEIYNLGREHPHVMDPAGESYLRQEGRGLCIGFYEKPCRPWAVDGTPWEFGHELLPDDFDKIEDSHRLCLSPLPGAGTRRGQVGDPWPLHLRPRWQPAGRPGAGDAQLLVGLRGDGRLQPGRRRRPDAGAMDDRGRGRARRDRRSMSRASAHGSRRAIHGPRWSRTTRPASPSPIRTRKSPPRGRIAPRRCMTYSTAWARSGASNSGWKWSTTSPRAMSRATKRRHSAAPTPSRPPRARLRRCAPASASTRCRTSASSASPAPARAPGLTGSWPGGFRSRAACR